MDLSQGLVLPFKWRGFNTWFSKFKSVTSENEVGKLVIRDLHFAAGTRSLEGIKIDVDLKVNDPNRSELFLCAFLADLTHLELFEPFIGNPDRFNQEYHGTRMIKPIVGRSESYELFIPEQGWILPSIWRFLVKSLGLHKKGGERMPDILVFAFSRNIDEPVLFATKPFDYYGNARRLKDDLMLGEFYRLLNLRQGASESDIQRAYVMSCCELQANQADNPADEYMGNNRARFSRIKQGYHVWAEKLQRNRELC